MTSQGVAIVTGVTGQDGFYLARLLLSDGWVVHAVARRPVAKDDIPIGVGKRLVLHEIDMLDVVAVNELVRAVQPDEIYNLAGQSSVSASFGDPLGSWQTNAESVAVLLEAVRLGAPATRVYQSSSGEMFGFDPLALHVTHDEEAPFLPASPYAAAKAAAHILCGSYRRAFGLRIACGILFNHESRRRSGAFLTRKVVSHLKRVKGRRGGASTGPPLALGNLKARRDWGFAPDYVAGMVAVLRQISVRRARLGSSEPDSAEYYRDYVLATGRLHAVWEMVDRAFELVGLELDWDLRSDEPAQWHATYRQGGALAVVVDPQFLRPSDPMSIGADPSRAVRELGWQPRMGIDHILRDLLTQDVRIA